MNAVKKLAAFTTLALSLSLPVTSAAAERINSVHLDISSDITVGDSGGDVDVTAGSGEYSVEDVEITNEPKDEWEDGDKPKLKVTLVAEDDYTFSSGFSKSDVDLDGDDATVTSVTRRSSELYVYITLDTLDEDGDDDYDLDVSGLEWDESDGMAQWDDATDANRYEVRLYRGSSTATSVFTTSDTSYDFSGYITRSGDYTFRVRGIYNSSHKGSWEESDSWNVSSQDADEISASSNSPVSGGGSGSGAWLRDNIGWWYCNADKSYPVNNWQYINNYWYYFNEYGYMVTGWVQWNSRWYYCGEDGAMLTETTTPDGYYVDGSGGWVQ